MHFNKRNLLQKYEIVNGFLSWQDGLPSVKFQDAKMVILLKCIDAYRCIIAFLLSIKDYLANEGEEEDSFVINLDLVIH